MSSPMGLPVESDSLASLSCTSEGKRTDTNGTDTRSSADARACVPYARPCSVSGYMVRRGRSRRRSGTDYYDFYEFGEIDEFLISCGGTADYCTLQSQTDIR